jgi:2-oxoglutarate ferredoxin oxidoreductase subunit delta
VKGKITIDLELCKGCELCIGVCPKGLLQKAKDLNAAGYFPAEFTAKERECEGCALCATMCPEIAIEVYRE